MVDTSNALTVLPASGVDTYRASTDAAHICGEIVKATATKIQGKRYVGVEGWQAIAIAHGCTASSRDVEAIEGGIRAVGEIRRMADGIVIATAEGFLGDDETTWAKRPMFARRAMAQTRAISRACRSAFAHVVVMIDKELGTTPAEEMQGVMDHAPNDGGLNSQARALDSARREIEEITGETRSTYQIAKERKAIKMLVDTARGAMDMCTSRPMLGDFWNENKAELREKLPEDDFIAFKASVEAKRDSLPAVAA